MTTSEHDHDDVDENDEASVVRPHASETRGVGGGRIGAIGMPVERSEDFGGTLTRLWHRVRVERGRVAAIFLLSIVSVTLMSLGPRVLGRATNVGLLIPAGVGVFFVFLGNSMGKVRPNFMFGVFCR